MSSLAPDLERPFTGQVTNAEMAHAIGREYVRAAGNVIVSHVRNELAGAVVFDEPAIALAPSPEDKWLACRIAMEEYGHHLKFKRLACELGVDPLGRKVLSVFDYELKSWVEFVVLKAIVDLAELIVMEELTDSCTYLPLRQLAAKLLPEEKFHVSFGRARARELSQAADTRGEVQDAVDSLVEVTLPFFGHSTSANNELYRRWGIKRSTNDQARARFIEESRQFVTAELGLDYPPVDVSWDG